MTSFCKTFALLLLIVLTACHRGDNRTRPPMPPPVVEEQWGREAIGANALHAQGITGTGVQIGIADTFFQHTSTALDDAGKLTCRNACVRSNSRNNSEHGHFVSVITLGDRDNEEIYGVAYNARLLFRGLSLGVGGLVDYRPTSPGDLAGNSLSTLGALQSLRGADIINMSFTLLGLVSNPIYSDAATGFSILINEASAKADPMDDSEKRRIYVVAAGNDNGDVIAEGVTNVRAESQEVCAQDPARMCLIADSPALLAGMAYFAPNELDGYWIAAVATDEDGEIADFSNRCGVAGKSCIAAPGVDITSLISDGTAAPSSGTSFSAPHISGALALLIDHYTDKMTGEEMMMREQIVERLFATADKSGAYARDAILDDMRALSTDCNRIDEPDPNPMFPLCEFNAIYGQGVVDLQNAIAPQGALRLALDGDINGAFRPFAGTRFAAAGAFGDAFTRSRIRLALFDSLNAPFFVPLAALATVPASGAAARLLTFPPQAKTYMYRGTHFTARSLAPADDPLLWPLLSFGQTGAAFSLSRGRGSGGFFIGSDSIGSDSSGGRAFYGAQAAYAPNASMRMQAGFLWEEDSILGGYSLGGFGASGRTGSFFTSLHFSQKLGGGDLSFRVHGGASESRGKDRGRDKGANGIARDFSTLLTSSFAAEWRWRDTERPEDFFALRVSQPLRVEKGSVALDYAYSRAASGIIYRARDRLSLAPSGRALALDVIYQTPFAGGKARLAANYTHNAGHYRGRHDIAAGLAFVRYF